MKEIKSQFSVFSNATLKVARDKTEEEIRIRTRRAEIEYDEKMRQAADPVTRGKLNQLMEIFRARMAAFIVGLKVMDEMIAKRDNKEFPEISWIENDLTEDRQ